MRELLPRELLTRRALVHCAVLPLCLNYYGQPLSAHAGVPPPVFVTDPAFGRLRSRYILFRPGQTLFESAGMIDSNPINKGTAERGLTVRGREQVAESARRLKEIGVGSPTIFYDNGARATQTAEVISQTLQIPRARLEPEFRWLEARGLGAWDGLDAKKTLARIRSMDALDIDNAADPSDDGTPSDSVNDVFSRLRNTISKIESTYGGGDFIIVPGDGTVLSVMAAAACSVDLREHARFSLPPGQFWDLRELVALWKAGDFVEMEAAVQTDEDTALGRQALRDIGPNLFSETEAGSWVLGPGVRR